MDQSEMAERRTVKCVVGRSADRIA